MLNELKTIADGMQKMGIKNDTLHNFLRPSPRSKIGKLAHMKVYIGKNGNLTRVEEVEDEVWRTYSYFFRDAHNQWPISKISEVYDPENFEEFTKNPLPPVSQKKTQATISKLIRCTKTLTTIIDRTEETEVIFELEQRLDKIKDQSAFLQQIIEKAMSEFPLESEDSKAITKKDIINGFYITLEVDDYEKLGIYPINHNIIISAIHNAYTAIDENEIKENFDGDKIDIFGEKYYESASGDIGKLSLGNLEFYAYSRNQFDKSNRSYNLNGSEACPLSPISKKAIMGVGSLIQDPDNKGTYWDIYFNKDTKLRTATIVFAPLKKEEMTNLNALCLGGRSQKAQDLKDRAIGIKVEENARLVIEGLRGCDAYEENGEAVIIVIDIPGNGPSFLQLSETISTKELVEMSGRWVDGWSNHEPSVLYHKKEKSMTTNRSFNVENLRQIVNKRWKRSANVPLQEKELVFDFINTSNAIKAFMGSQSELNRIAHIFAKHQIFLLLDIGIKMQNRIQNKGSYNIRSHRQDIFSLPIAFGQILYLMGIKKEDYVKSLPYMVGQLFAAASRVQKDIITELHSGSDNLPTMLTGTKHIHKALTNPSVAINILLSSVGIYLEKAKNRRSIEYYVNGKSSSFYSYYLFRSAVKVILENDLPKQWSDTDRMLLSLGYFQNRSYSHAK